MSNILLEMQTIGYLDCMACNFPTIIFVPLISWCDAVKLLKGMGRAGCVPDLESYNNVKDNLRHWT